MTGMDCRCILSTCGGRPLPARRTKSPTVCTVASPNDRNVTPRLAGLDDGAVDIARIIGHRHERGRICDFLGIAAGPVGSVALCASPCQLEQPRRSRLNAGTQRFSMKCFR